MASKTFFCIDAHTCGNPVRVVAGGGPDLEGATMSDYRQDFMTRYDWIRRALMFEPRGHDVMSGSVLYKPLRAERDGRSVERVRLFNVPSFLEATEVAIDVPGLGPLKLDVAYGGNYYAIVDPQPGYAGLESLTADQVLRLSPVVRRLMNEKLKPVHPENPTIKGVSHVMWTGKPLDPKAHARNAVFYGDRAIDRSPCGTGTSARMAQLAAKGKLKVGDAFVHESIIGSLFEGRVEGETRVGVKAAIRPSVAGWARVTGYNTIFVDDRDPYAHGFQLV